MIQKLNDYVIPAGKRYLGDVTEFKFDVFPNRCILNKQLPGCGFTEYCLTGDEDVILASPRIMLINNKKDQHGNDVFLVVNEMDKDPGVDRDISKPGKTMNTGILSIKSDEELEKEREELKERNSRAYTKIRLEFESYYNEMLIQGKPVKVLVTYDSYHIIRDIFAELDYQRFCNSNTIVDEFQSILHDSRFKSTTEMQFMEELKTTPKVMFASATPMLEEYINMLEEFDGLPYIELDWISQDSTRIIKPDLDIYTMRSVGEKVKEIIQTYLSGNYESIVVMRNGQPTKVESKEAVFYVNSVNHITSIIKKNNLTPDQVLILCSKTDDNASKIRRRLGKGFSIGHVPNPKKGETFPMFTFCTRTVYLGADFYSTCARTFIFSDSNIDSLAVDISEDLPQILGRQRLTENPWKNSATFYYRSTCDYRKISQAIFQEQLDNKMDKTNKLLMAYKESRDELKYAIAEKYQKDAKNSSYKDDYVGVNIIYNKLEDGRVIKILKPKINQLVYVNEIRAFRIQQIDYKDRFTVFAKVSTQLTPDDIVNIEVSNFLFEYESKKTLYDKLRLLCELDLSKQALNIILAQIPDSDEIKSYYTILGPQRLYELGYNTTRIKKELGIITFSPELLRASIYREFKVGDRLTLSDIKDKLTNIYSSINYGATPKATDLNEFFEIEDSRITIVDDSGQKKRVRGFILSAIKPIKTN